MLTYADVCRCACVFAPAEIANGRSVAYCLYYLKERTATGSLSLKSRLPPSANCRSVAYCLYYLNLSAVTF